MVAIIIMIICIVKLGRNDIRVEREYTIYDK